MATAQPLLASKLVIIEEEPRNAVFPAVPTAVLGMVGVTQRGPFGPTLVTSFQEYVKIFGAFDAAADVPFAALGFFLNAGGSGTVWVIRVVHLTDITSPATRISVAATIPLVDIAPASTITVNAKTDGAWANGYDIEVTAATNGIALDFNLVVKDVNDVILEVFPNLTNADTTSVNAVEVVINNTNTGSDFISVVSLLTTRPVDQVVTLAAGDSGLTGLDDADFTGSAAGPTGIFELDQIENLTILIVPGRATSAVHNAMLAYGGVTRGGQVFSILDPPAGNSASAIVTYVVTTASLKGSSTHGAIYWPRVKVVNPSTTIFTSDANGLIVVPPSGFIAGAASRGDNSRIGGIYHNFAGLDSDNGVPRGQVIGVLGLETDEVLDVAKRDLVYPELINPITTESGAPIFIDGTRTLKADAQFPTVAQRRGASFIERVIKTGLTFTRHANITDGLLRRASRVVTAFLLEETRKGAFVTQDPAKAFFVDFSNVLNPPSSRAARTVNGRVGLAFAEPADFVVVIVGKDTRLLDEEIASIQQGRS